MSYEGYEQHICANGHRFDCDYSYNNGPNAQPEKCHCGAESVWMNPVDETNCDSVGFIPHSEWEKFKLTEEVFETCNLGHSHLVNAETFRIPSEEEKKKARHYVNNEGQMVPLYKGES